MNKIKPLSEREQEVFELLVHGLYYREISARLEIAYETVHSHARNIYKKLRVRSRNQAVAKFLMDRAADLGQPILNHPVGHHLRSRDRGKNQRNGHPENL